MGSPIVRNGWVIGCGDILAPSILVNSIVAVDPQFDAVDDIRSQEAELYFYGRVLGFTPADEIEPVEIENDSAL